MRRGARSARAPGRGGRRRRAIVAGIDVTGGESIAGERNVVSWCGVCDEEDRRKGGCNSLVRDGLGVL